MISEGKLMTMAGSSPVASWVGGGRGGWVVIGDDLGGEIDDDGRLVPVGGLGAKRAAVALEFRDVPDILDDGALEGLLPEGGIGRGVADSEPAVAEGEQAVAGDLIVEAEIGLDGGVVVAHGGHGSRQPGVPGGARNW